MKHEFVSYYKNIRIRPLEEYDIESLRNWRNNPTNTKFLTKISYITPEMQEKWFKDGLEKPNEYIFAIDEIKELNKLVGSFSLYNIVDEEAEFGKFLIGEDRVHGKSIGLYTLTVALEIAFNKLKLKKVYLRVYKDNYKRFFLCSDGLSSLIYNNNKIQDAVNILSNWLIEYSEEDVEKKLLEECERLFKKYSYDDISFGILVKGEEE